MATTNMQLNAQSAYDNEEMPDWRHDEHVLQNKSLDCPATHCAQSIRQLSSG